MVPILGFIFVQNLGLFDYQFRNKVGGVMLLLSPLVVPAGNELSQLHGFDFLRGKPGSAWIIVVVNFTFYGALLFLIRRRVLARADHYLRSSPRGKGQSPATSDS